MKTILISILLFAIALPCSGFTQQDLAQIERLMDKKLEPIVKEINEIKIDIANIKGKMATKDDIIAINQNLSDRTDSLKSDIITINQNLSDKIDTLYGIIIAAFVTLIVVIAVPQILIVYRERRESRLSREVDELKREIAELKEKRIINP
ncbi:MAG: hypothetical protein ACE5PV_10460 [Candidatus Poribacteria bacterium]